jgi:hypothetical protein
MLDAYYVRQIQALLDVANLFKILDKDDVRISENCASVEQDEEVSSQPKRIQIRPQYCAMLGVKSGKCNTGKTRDIIYIPLPGQCDAF